MVPLLASAAPAGGVSGLGGVGAGGGHRWGRGGSGGEGPAAGAQPLPCLPESLQEKPGYRLECRNPWPVQAGLGVRVPCSFSYPWSSWYSSMEPFIYWFREGDGPHSDPVATNNPKRPVKTETQGRFRLLGDPSHKDCSLSISDARIGDTGVYYFRVERRSEI